MAWLLALTLILVGACSSPNGADRERDRDDPPTGAGHRIDRTYRAPAGPQFAVPVKSPERQAIVRTLLKNIKNTPRGELIRLVLFSFTITVVSDALIAAERRGVRVQIIIDRHSLQWSATKALDRHLGRDPTRPSYLKPIKRSARGAAGHQHQKTWMFSRTGASRHVVMAGSMNLTNFGTGQYADMMSYVDRPDVWRAFNHVYRLQVRDQPMADPVQVHRLGADTAYFYPGFTSANDPILTTLRQIPGGPTTHLRISQYAWHHPRGYQIADEVEALARSGARVEFIEGPYVDDDITGILRSAGATIHSGKVAKKVHTKLTIAEYDGRSGRQKLVITGSDNFESLSLDNDDLDLVLDLSNRPKAYDAYVDFYRGIVGDNA